MFNQKYMEARQELKRADHLIYVSLKYTRTVDVMNNILERLINTYSFIMDGILEKAKNDGKIKETIKIPGLKVEKIKELYKGNEISDYLDLFILLRKMRNAGQQNLNEYRRGVKMIAEVEGKLIEVTIDIITDYYKRTIDFMEFIKDNFSDFLEEEMEE